MLFYPCFLHTNTQYPTVFMVEPSEKKIALPRLPDFLLVIFKLEATLKHEQHTSRPDPLPGCPGERGGSAGVRLRLFGGVPTFQSGLPD